MIHRPAIITLVCFAVLVGGGLGTSNGMVLCTDVDGHLAIEAPHLDRGHCHEDAAEPANAQHSGSSRLHRPGEMPGECSDSFLTFQTVGRWSGGTTLASHALAGADECVPTFLAPGVAPLSCGPAFALLTSRGDAAPCELAAIRSVVLLV